MDVAPKKSWRQISWTFPASVLLHVLIVGVFYLQWPVSMEAPAEPESISVELVEPPKEEPPAQEEKAEEPPPPAETEPEEEQPPPPPPSSLPNIEIRPDATTQLDERNQPARQEEEGGQEQPQPAEKVDMKPSTEPPTPDTPPAQVEPSAAETQPTPDEGEIAAAEQKPEEQAEATIVPQPRPEIEKTSEDVQAGAPAGTGDPELPAARRILSTPASLDPTLRQMLGELSPRRRLGQICSNEAIEQAKSERPDLPRITGIQPHIGKGDPVSGNTVNAKGALNVGTDWYHISFYCMVDQQNYSISEFRYRLGEKLTPEEVRKSRLPAY